MIRLRPAPGCTLVLLSASRRVPVRDQQTLLVRVVLHPVRLGGGPAEVVRAGLQVLVVRDVRAVARDVVVVDSSSVIGRTDDAEAVSVQAGSPSAPSLNTRRAVGGDGEVVAEEAAGGDAAVRQVVQADADLLARVRVQRDRDVGPGAARCCRSSAGAALGAVGPNGAPSTVPSSGGPGRPPSVDASKYR